MFGPSCVVGSVVTPLLILAKCNLLGSIRAIVKERKIHRLFGYFIIKYDIFIHLCTCPHIPLLSKTRNYYTLLHPYYTITTYHTPITLL